MDQADKKVLNKAVAFLLVVVVVFVATILIANKNGTKIQNENIVVKQEVSPKDYKKAIVNIGGKNLLASVADTSSTRQKGLSGQYSLNDKTGMYFVFEEADTHAFWMKDMKFPIDIIWLNESLKIVHIAENVSPDTYPETLKPDEPAKYVLEVAAGYVSRNGVELGDTILVTDVK